MSTASLRRKFVDALLELEAFYSQKEVEFSQESTTQINFNQMAGAPTFLFQNDNSVSVGNYLRAIKEILQTLQGSRVQNLLEMKNSKSFVGRLANSIQIKLDRKNIALANASECRRRAATNEKEYKETLPIITKLKEDTLVLKKHLEAAISKLYNGRPVTIYGEIERL